MPYEIKKLDRREYRLFFNGKRTAYVGDTYEQASKMLLHLEGAKTAQPPEHDFVGTQTQWEDRVIGNADHFRLHRYYGVGQCDRAQVKTFAEAVAAAKAAKQEHCRVLVYAITASGRSVLVTEDKWVSTDGTLIPN